MNCSSIINTRSTLLLGLIFFSLILGCSRESASDEPSEAGVEAGASVEGGEIAGMDSNTAADEAGAEGGETAGVEAGAEGGGEAGAGVEGGEEVEPPPIEAPIIRRVRAYINRQDGGLGIEIIGRDEDNNLLAFKLEYFYADGSPLILGEAPGPIAIYFSNLRQGSGDFIGEWSVPFLLENASDLENLARIEVSVIDETEYESPVTSIELLNTPTSPEGESCDLNRGLSRCEDGYLCDLRPGGSTKCKTAITECPMTPAGVDLYEAIDLNAEGGRYEGDTSGRATYGTGFCGGGTSSQLFTFTADQAGEYIFTAQPTGSSESWEGAPDTLMWIRSHCGFSDWVAELGCNDDINVGLGDLGSQLRLDLTEGQVIYIFIDGYSDPESGQAGWSGPFVIEATTP